MSAANREKLQGYATTFIQDSAGAVPGVWVGIWDPKKGWAIVAAGNAKADGAAARPVDHSRIGSVTKTFVATQILRLVDQKRLKLTDTIGDLLPAIATAHPYVADVTVEQMLGMRSGIPDYTEVPGAMKQAYENPERTWTARQLIELGLGSATTLGPPAYSNTNYILLGEIARKATGRSIYALVNADLRRLGMTQSRLPRPGQTAMPRPFTHGYNYAPGVFSLAQVGVDVPVGSEQQDDVTTWGQAAGSMYSTVADLGRWAATGLGLSELSKATAARRLTAQPISGGAIDYGLGMENFGNGWIGHDGQAIGWEAKVAYNAQTGAVVVILVNETGSLRGATAGIAARYFPELVN
jgi:D-alanyl-D-alanine carboxypeptidase